MKVTLSENGESYPDAEVQTFAQYLVAYNKGVHTSNILLVDCIRAELAKMDTSLRPQVTWNFYGQEVHFNEYLASSDAWDDKRCFIGPTACGEILRHARFKVRANENKIVPSEAMKTTDAGDEQQ